MNLEYFFQDIKSSPFLEGYADKFDSYQELPFLDKKKLRELLRNNFHLEKEQKGVHLLRTGGTMDESLIVPIDPAENHLQRQMLVDRLVEEKLITSTDVCINLFAYKHLYRSAALLDHIIEYSGATSVGLAGTTIDEYVMNFARILKANTIVGSPSRIFQLANYLKEHNQTFPFKKFIFGGEVLPDYFLDVIRNQFHTEQVLGLFGAIEIGTFAYCNFTANPNKYRILDSMVHIEIDQPNAEGYGNMVITNLVKRRFPIIKYRIGDIARLIPEDDANYFEMKSRGAYGFRLKQTYIFEDQIKPLLRNFDRYQIRLSYNDRKKTCIEVLVSKAGLMNGELDNLERMLREVIGIAASEYQLEVKKAISKDYYQNPISLKSPRLVDNRIKAVI
ncbi:hypothetical protein GF337_19365 [candidate division KSB1 bacterium]|nr:hypothetical protein [candidate division KSB1 bacterium]